MSVLSKFRTPAWRPFRAAMFVSMGLSAIFPVLHGLWLYGTVQMRKQIGLSWLVLQGVLYIFGACVYAVIFSSTSRRLCTRSNMIHRFACLKSGFPADTIYGATRIRSSTYWWSWLPPRISPACSRRSTIAMVSWGYMLLSDLLFLSSGLST